MRKGEVLKRAARSRGNKEAEDMECLQDCWGLGLAGILCLWQKEPYP